MPAFTDQAGHEIHLPHPPRSIVSLVPSQTELLAYLGREKEVTGITKFCIHPSHWRKEKTIVGGTKNIRMNVLEKLAPELVLANKEENVREQVIEIGKKYPTWTSDIHNLENALEMIRQVGLLTDTVTDAEKLIEDIGHAFEAAKPGPLVISAAYLIWKDPFMTVGHDTFIHDMLTRAGFKNVFAETDRYPEVTISDLHAAGTEVILLSSEPYPFREMHLAEIRALLPYSKVFLADGEMFSWYGSRLLQAPQYFASLRNQINIELGA